MSSAHEITIALSKNSAQSDSISAAPRRWFRRKASIISASSAPAPVAALAVAPLAAVALLVVVALLAAVAPLAALAAVAT